jgi:hypothetical protein
MRASIALPNHQCGRSGKSLCPIGLREWGFEMSLGQAIAIAALGVGTFGVGVFLYTFTHV